ncbi:hypothetical protein DL769_007059 [Monosporascus sp. CRB-8-3]|nr:hypothetical protein DL769_007059 [Monosporascus sp. CRB-8-3]
MAVATAPLREIELRRFSGRRTSRLAWGHDTSGWSGECGSSHIRSLWYDFMIFTAATQSYLFLVSRVVGNDLLYAAKATQKAWADVLGRRYVVMGHSQGGNVAWGASIVASEDEELRRGYLGTIAGSPWTLFRTSVSFQQSAAGLNSIITRAATGSSRSSPRSVGAGGISLGLSLGLGPVREDWDRSWYAEAFDNTSNIGGPFAGPMLVLQGTGDASVNVKDVEAAVNATCGTIPDAQIEITVFEGVSHKPVMYAGQQIWLDWIADRLAGKKAPAGCQRHLHSPLLDVESYLKDRNWFLEWNKYPYGVV